MNWWTTCSALLVCVSQMIVLLFICVICVTFDVNLTALKLDVYTKLAWIIDWIIDWIIFEISLLTEPTTEPLCGSIGAEIITQLIRGEFRTVRTSLMVGHVVNKLNVLYQLLLSQMRPTVGRSPAFRAEVSPTSALKYTLLLLKTAVLSLVLTIR